VRRNSGGRDGGGGGSLTGELAVGDGLVGFEESLSPVSLGLGRIFFLSLSKRRPYALF
jgi:hypothetical protein